MNENPGATKRRLSAADAAFLYLERKEIPLNIGAIFVFDGPIPFDAFVATCDARLKLIPRYRQVVVSPPFNIGYPTWEDAPDFDVRRHIFQEHLQPPGGNAELEALAGRLFGQVMDRGKPLWEIHLVDGLEGDRGALIVRAHHALADGVSGAAVIYKLITSPTPETSLLKDKRLSRARHSRPAPPSLAGALLRAASSTLENLAAAEAGLVDLVFSLGSDPTKRALMGAARLLPEIVSSVERLPFNKPCTGERKFCWTECELTRVKAVRAVAGGTVNDVVLTILTRAIARYAELHGETIAHRLIRVICPVNQRQDSAASLGNQISFLPVALPMDIDDPVKMLQAVACRTETMKQACAASLVGLLGAFLGVTPPPVQAAVWGGLPEVLLPFPLFNIICTNVPGPTETLYTAGRRVIAVYPQVPTGYELGVGCCVSSYGGKLFFGLTADAGAAPDVTRLRDFLSAAFEELCAAAGVAPTQRRPEARKVRRPRRPRAPRAPRPDPPAADEPSGPVAAEAAEPLPNAVAEAREEPEAAPPEPAVAVLAAGAMAGMG